MSNSGQPVIDALDNLAKQVSSLKGKFDYTDLRSVDQNLRKVVDELKSTLPAARAAREARTAEKGRLWLLRGGIVFAALLGLVGAFGGGAYWTALSLRNMSITINTAAACHRAGGEWNVDQNGKYGCWIGPK